MLRPLFLDSDSSPRSLSGTNNKIVRTVADRFVNHPYSRVSTLREGGITMLTEFPWGHTLTFSKAVDNALPAPQA